MDMTSKRTINAEKGKQGFQKTVKAEPVTEANLEQVQANKVPIRDRFISDIAQDFLPEGASDSRALNAMLDEMSRKRYAMENAGLQIEQALAARDVAEQFPDVASVEFQVGSERDFSFITNTGAFDADGNTFDDLDIDMEEILDNQLSSSSKEIFRDDFYAGGEKYAKLDIAELNKKWR